MLRPQAAPSRGDRTASLPYLYTLCIVHFSIYDFDLLFCGTFAVNVEGRVDVLVVERHMCVCV